MLIIKEFDTSLKKLVFITYTIESSLKEFTTSLNKFVLITN
jgi:hypothetical protein